MEKLELLKENDLKIQWNYDKDCHDRCLNDCLQHGYYFDYCNAEDTTEY